MSKVGVTFEELKTELLADDVCRKEYDLLAPRYQAVSQLIKARKEENITQEELAERIGTKKSNISRIEAGNQNLSLDQLAKIAEALGKSVTVTIN